MADDSQEDRPKRNQRKPVSAEQRRLLQQNFERGEQAKNRDRNYADEMYAQCVIGDPGNRVYVTAFLDNLQKKFNNKGKGGRLSSFSGMGARATLKKSIAKGELDKAVRAAVDLLRINPWDIPALVLFAEALGGLCCYETQLIILNHAQKSAPDPGDPEIARVCAKALAAQGLFDQAMGCWERVKKYHPNNEESQHAIAGLHTDKIGWVGSASRDEAKNAANKAGGKDTRETELNARFEADPASIDAASDLADFLAHEDRYEEAETVLKTNFSATGEAKVQEHLEDIRLRRYRHQLAVAEKRANDDPSDATKKLLRNMQIELLRIELEIFRNRSDRYPGNTNIKYEYAIRLKRSGNYNEAIKMLQEARNDPKKKAIVFVELGNCFFKIKQFKLAMKNYADALELMTDRELELRKKSLYRAGVVAMDYLSDLDSAERYLTTLAGLDFSFEDVSQRLDKINTERHKQ